MSALSPKYVQKIGIELEGGWNRRFKDTEIFGDISVQRPGRTAGNLKECTCAYPGHDPQTCHWGEIASPPLDVRSGLEWMRDHFPDGVNTSCGFHVHASVRHERDYANLMDKQFYNLFLSKVRDFGKSEGFADTHPLWERLREKSQKAPHPARFCNRPFAAHDQFHLTSKQDVRRSALNYCYAMHGTIECRVFPAFSEPEVAARAVLAYVGTIEDWLENHPPVKPTVLLLRLREIERSKEPFKILRSGV